MNTSVLHRSISFLAVFFLLSIFKEGSISGKEVYSSTTIIPIIPIGNRKQNDVRTSGFLKAVRSFASHMINDANFQREASLPILTQSISVPLPLPLPLFLPVFLPLLLPVRHFKEQSILAFKNTVRFQSEFSVKTFKILSEGTDKIISSPSFPHFVAGLTAGNKRKSWK